MDSELVDRLDAHFQKIMDGDVTEPLKYISDVFDVTNGLKKEELLIGKNLISLEYLFTISAITFSSKINTSAVHPVIAVPSVGINEVYIFFKNRLDFYRSQDPKIKFFSIDGKDLVGNSLMQFDAPEPTEIAKIFKWKIENEEKARNSRLFLINNANAITGNSTITLKEIMSQLKTVSSEASYIIFLSPSALNFIQSTLNDDEFQSKFSRTIVFEGFDVSDVNSFREIIEDRLKSNENTQKISIDTLNFDFALKSSRGIPFYAFKIIEDEIKTMILNSDENNSITQIDNSFKNNISILWKNIDSLTNGQIDILTAFMTFNDNRANIYELQDKIKLFRKSVGNRSAILQQVRKLYENELLDRERPIGSREVYYRIKLIALPGIEYRIKELILGGK